MNENIKEVQLFKDDFRIIYLTLMESRHTWESLIEDDPDDLPGGMDITRAKKHLYRIYEVVEKIETILGGEPLKVDGESLQKIMNIIKEQGNK